MTEKLKPCPFCGECNKIKLRKFKTDKYRILCQNCGATGPAFTQYSWEYTSIRAQNKARTSWNKRFKEDRQCPLKWHLNAR